MTGTAQLDGKVAIVTGGSRGIGRAIAAALLDQGAQVALTGRSAESLAQAEAELQGGHRLLAVTADVASEADVHRLVRDVTARFGGLDILVNNAGVGRLGDVADQSTHDWREMIETNLTGVFFCSRAAIPHLKQRGGGWIVNISSLASQNPFPGGACYSATKAGLNAFSHALMQEVRHLGIRVTVVAPGSVNTNFIPRERADEDAGSWKLAPEDVAQTVVDLIAHHPRSLPSRVDLRPSMPRK
jgi:NAD(P)-dependent dehydrogenase (short-subunit alcohol dehydrogenase family)